MTRESIIQTISSALLSNPSIHAAWLEGSDAHGLSDDYSDIDLWLDVEDGMQSDALLCVKTAASVIGEIDYEYEPNHAHPQIRQAFFHISNTPEHLILDVCIQSHSREASLLKGFADHKVRMLFDKCGAVKYLEPDWPALENAQSKRARELKDAFHLALIRVDKELHRRNFLEALYYYQREMLAPLVEVLRIKHQPTKQEYHLKHITRDLPADAVAKLEYLFAISSIEDIKTKYHEAALFFEKAIDSLRA